MRNVPPENSRIEHQALHMYSFAPPPSSCISHDGILPNGNAAAAAFRKAGGFPPCNTVVLLGLVKDYILAFSRV